MSGDPRRRVSAGGNLWILLRKELRLGVRSASLYLLVVTPLVVSLIMRVVLTSGGPKPAKLAIVGPERPRLEQVVKLVSTAGGIKPFRLVKVEGKTPAARKKKGMALLRKGRIAGLLVLPVDFDDRLAAGKRPRATLYFDETGGTSAFNLRVVLRDMFRLQAGQKEPARITAKGIRKISPWQAMLPAWVVMVLLSAITWMPSSLATERQSQTLRAVLVTPVSLWEFVIGKGLFGIGIGLVGGVLVLLANASLTGNIPLVIAVIALGSTVAALIGLFLALIFETPQSASGAAAALYIPLLWGAFFSEMTGIVGWVSKLTPSHHMAEGIKRALFSDGTWSSEWLTLLVLLATNGLLLVACVWALRREAERS